MSLEQQFPNWFKACAVSLLIGVAVYWGIHFKELKRIYYFAYAWEYYHEVDAFPGYNMRCYSETPTKICRHKDMQQQTIFKRCPTCRGAIKQSYNRKELWNEKPNNDSSDSVYPM